MVATIDKLTNEGCSPEDNMKVCRSRGGESCAFDGAMIVLQPIADTAHIVHGPIACCGNSWEGRGTRSRAGAYDKRPVPMGKTSLHQMGFTTDMGEIDIVYGSEEKLRHAVQQAYEAVNPKAIFVYSTCVSGLTGEDIDAVCKRVENELGIRVIPVNAPGFVGPKNLGNRIAGEVLLNHVIGTGDPPVMTHTDINLIGEYNIAGDLWLVEPLLASAGIRVLSRITGDSTFDEVTWAHRAKLNVLVCSRALINVAREMERRYGIPYIEVSFYGRTEIAKALRAIGNGLGRLNGLNGLSGLGQIETVIQREEKRIAGQLMPYAHLKGKRAVLYTGGVKSWSFISALQDLGIEIVAAGTRKSTAEDEEKMREILGPGAPLVEDVSPKNLLTLLKDRNADMLIAGGRNQYLAVKEGYPFVDVNQERHVPYAGYQGLVNLAMQISNSMRFYRTGSDLKAQDPESEAKKQRRQSNNFNLKAAIVINPLKHSPAIGAAMALQGIHRALPVIHGAQGCSFLGKVLLTKHFREPISLASSKLFIEDVVMESEGQLAKTIEEFIDKNAPSLVGVLTSGLTEVKGDDVPGVVKRFRSRAPQCEIVHISTPDYDGGIETGYAAAMEAIINNAPCIMRNPESPLAAPSSAENRKRGQINIIAGPHLTPADFTEMADIVESFGMKAVILPNLSALDGSRQGFSPLAEGGATIEEINSMGNSDYTIVLGKGMERAAQLLQRKFGVACRVFESVAGLSDTDALMETLSMISGSQMPEQYRRQRKILKDAMRDLHCYVSGKGICMALDPDLSVQTSRWIGETGAIVNLAVVPTLSDAVDLIQAQEVEINDLFSIRGRFDLLISNSHAESTAKKLDVPLYEMGFPVYKTFGQTAKVTIGYRGTLNMLYDAANLLMKGHG